MKEKQVYKKIWPLPVKNFIKFFLWHQAVHIVYLNTKCGSTRLCDQSSGVQPADRQTDTRQTSHRQTKVKQGDLDDAWEIPAV